MDNSNNQNIDSNYEIGTSKKNIVFLVLSIINIVTIVPVVVTFGVFFVIFGAFSDSLFTYYSVLIGCGLYILISILTLIKTIWDVVKYNDKLKKIFKIGILIVIGLMIGLLLF